MADKALSSLTAATTLTVDDLRLAGLTAGSRKVRAGVDGTAVGTAFGTPTTNDRLFRTDLGIEYYYDGSQWLSTQIFSLNIPASYGVTITTDGVAAPNPWAGIYSIYIFKTVFSTIMTGVGNWTPTVITSDGGSVATVVTGSAYTNTNWDHEVVTPNATVASTVDVFFVRNTENSGTATAYAAAIIHYRLIG